MTSQIRSVSNSWILAVRLCETYIKRPRKTDEILQDLPDSLPPNERRRCQFLFLGVIRNLSLIVWTIDSLAGKEPRRKLKSILFVAVGEVLAAEAGDVPKIIDHAVENAKKLLSEKEVGFINAIMRRIRPLLKAKKAEVDAALLDGNGEEKVGALALYYSHPEWLVRRWIKDYSEESTKMLLRWNQEPPPVYLRIFEGESGSSLAEGLEETSWRGFYSCEGVEWKAVHAILEEGRGYVMDPAGRLPVQLLNPIRGENVLDLCAAPGGKSVLIAEHLKGSSSLLVSLDRPGSRMKRLRRNLAGIQDLRCRIVESDLLDANRETFEAQSLPGFYDAVLIDVPCSNTGVLRRRPDAKWRLAPGQVGACAVLQGKLLDRAAYFVRAGGRLVYSTCSIEREENEGVVESFLKRKAGDFKLINCSLSKPWERGHDGGAAFLLQRSWII